MKSSELIKRIQAIDPSGQMDVCIGNVGVTDVYTSPATEHGWYQVVNRPPNGSITAKYIGQGRKLVLHTTSISEILRDYPNTEVEVVGEDSHGYRKQVVDDWRGFTLSEVDKEKGKVLNWGDPDEDDNEDNYEDDDDEE